MIVKNIENSALFPIILYNPLFQESDCDEVDQWTVKRVNKAGAVKNEVLQPSRLELPNIFALFIGFP